MSDSPHGELLRSLATIVWRARTDGWATDLESWVAFTRRPVEPGWGWLEDVHPEDRDRTRQVWEEAVTARRQYQVDYRIRRHDGQYRWFSVHAIPLLDDEGEVDEWLGACIDINDRVAVQTQLESVVNNMSEAFITIDRDWTITFQNREGARINDKPTHAILGKHMWEEWPEVPGSPLEANYRKAWAENRPIRFEHRYYDPGKYDIWLDIQAVPTEDGGLGIFYLDISERKAAELAVAESDARFRQLTDNLQAAFLLTDPLGERVDYASAFAASLWGVAPEELARRPELLRESVHPEDRELVQEEVWTDGPGAAQTDYRIVGSDGAVRWVSHRRTPIPANRDEDDSRPTVGHIVTDITDRKHLEDRLQQSQRMESLGRLAGGVAHDFNNVLTVILGRASLLKLRLPNEDVEQVSEGLEEIEEAATRASGITRQILAFAKRQEGEPVNLDLNESLKRGFPLMRRLLGEGIEMVPLLAGDVPVVRLDPAQLDQILVNLAANAAAAMGDTGTFTLRTSKEEIGEGRATVLGVQPGEFARVEVQDTGSGIPQSIIGEIFDPFFTTKGEKGGTGLGLATVYGLVSAAGGALSVSSQLGKGTTFTIRLPAAHGEAEDSVQGPSIPDLQGSEEILVVEDESRLRSLVVDILDGQGYRVRAFRSGADALDAVAKDGPPDLVITDMIMPGMSGAELVERLREDHPSLPVLTISGYRGEDEVPRGVLPDDLVFLPKPFTPHELSQRVRRILDHRRG